MGFNGMLPTRKEVADRLKAGTSLMVSTLFIVIAVLGTTVFAGWVVWKITVALGVWVLYGLFSLLALLLCLYALGQVALAKGWEMTAEQKIADKKARQTAAIKRPPMQLDSHHYYWSN